MAEVPRAKLVLLGAVEKVVGTADAGSEEDVGETSGEENWAKAGDSMQQRSTSEARNRALHEGSAILA
jgi:hypothetical protein